jgi:Ala-tRNA(Pro) deacylase
MAVAAHLANYLTAHGTAYEVIEHRPSVSAMEAAQQAHVPPDRMLKAVLLRDHQGYMLALLPALEHINLGYLREWLHRRLRLATEPEVNAVFTDCDSGAVPAIGAAYSLETVIDDTLRDRSDVYFEAGDHRSVIHMHGPDFWRLTGAARSGRFGSPQHTRATG